MFKTSTYFIKEQIPGITIRQLLSLYESELGGDGMHTTPIADNTIEISKWSARWNFIPGYRELEAYSKSTIQITDEDTEYMVEYQLGLGGITTRAAITGILFGLLSFFASDFNPGGLLFGVFAFVVIFIIRYVYLQITLPIYFVRLRDTIERRVQDN